MIEILVCFAKNKALQITATTSRTTIFGEKVLIFNVNLFFNHFADMEARNNEHIVLSHRMKELIK